MASKSPKYEEIDLTQLTLQDLSLHKQRFDQEIGVLQESIQGLKTLQSKFQESKNNLDRIQQSQEGSTLMVPLTGSMYVKGKVIDTKSFIINIGTGYYVKQSMADSKDYLTRRVKYLTEQIEKLQLAGAERVKVREAINEVLQIKIRSTIGTKDAEPGTADQE